MPVEHHPGLQEREHALLVEVVAEQKAVLGRRLEWRDVDMLACSIGVGRSKNGYARRVPMNSVVRSVLVDVGARRARPADPTESVFTAVYRTVARLFARAVDRAQAALRDAEKDASKLDGYTWHGNRHTFASRLVMAGVDLLTVKELGSWRTLSMVQRYAHLAAAVERLVIPTVQQPDGPAARERPRCPRDAGAGR